MSDSLKRVLFRAAKPFIHAAYRQTRGMTLGTRTLVLKEQAAEVLLVRHGYAPGWLLPPSVNCARKPASWRRRSPCFTASS